MIFFLIDKDFIFVLYLFTVSSVLTSSTGFGSNSYAGSDSSYHMPSYSKYDTTKQTLDNQLKEIDSQLDSQLLSKVGETETFY